MDLLLVADLNVALCDCVTVWLCGWVVVWLSGWLIGWLVDCKLQEDMGKRDNLGAALLI